MGQSPTRATGGLEQEAVLGLDGGGSKTDALLLGLDGQVLAYGRGGTAVSLYADAETVVKEYKKALDAVFGKVLRPVKTRAVGGTLLVSNAGVARPLVEYWQSAPVVTLTECEACCMAALHRKEGLVILSGTGSFVETCGAEHVRVGGGGPHLGDEGSGFWIGMEALRQVYAASDDLAPRGALYEAFVARFNLHRHRDLIRVFQVEGLSRWEIAGLAPLVKKAAEAGDGVALDILHRAAGRLFWQFEGLWRRLEQHERYSKVVLAGGVLQHIPYVADELTRLLVEAHPELETTQLRLPVVLGCAYAALEATGVRLSAALVQQAENSLAAVLGGDKGDAGPMV